jgi:hypothetical protein
MLKKLGATLVACAMAAGSAQAQSSCDPEKLAGLIETYAAAPFSARTYRVLAGLGDPMLEPAASYDTSYESGDAWKELVKEIIPNSEPRDIAHECRVGYPLQVLQGHVAKLGKQSPYVLQWLKAQDKVFDACAQPSNSSIALPELLSVDAAIDATQRDDRAYQQASIAFYNDKTKALELFRAIASSSSQHKAAARYNIANLLANAKNVVEARKEANAIMADASLAPVHGITKELLGYIANLEDTTQGWSQLINDSLKAATASTSAISSAPEEQRIYQRALADLDYAGVGAKTGDWWLEAKLPQNPTLSKAILDVSRSNPMALWMLAGQSVGEKAERLPWAMQGEKWQSYASSYVDRALIIQPSASQLPLLPKTVLETLRAKPDDATREALWTQVNGSLAAAQHSCGAAPETAALGPYLTQAVRISAATGNYDEAYFQLSKLSFKYAPFISNGLMQKLAGQILGQGNAQQGRQMRDKLLTTDYFTSLPESIKISATDGFADFMGWVAEDETKWKEALLRGTAKTGHPMLNFQSNDTLWRYANDLAFSPQEKALFARAAWTRAYALGAQPKPSETEQLMALNPKIKASAEKVTRDYPKARADGQRLLTVLRNPRLGILVNAPDIWTTSGLEEIDEARFDDVTGGDHNDRNWWCPFELDRQLGALRRKYDQSVGIADLNEYGRRGIEEVYDQTLANELAAKRDTLLAQHPMIRSVSWKRILALAGAPSAPKRLTEAAIKWGKASKGQDGAPEALALAVRSTRYGCNWHGGHGAYSKIAHGLLRSRFAVTSWAAQTPYWFDCQRNEWDDKGTRILSCKPMSWPKQTIPK